jgi:hypothetical protein
VAAARALRVCSRSSAAPSSSIAAAPAMRAVAPSGAKLGPHDRIRNRPAPSPAPAPVFALTPKAANRVVEFFTVQTNNEHTRKAYMNATQRFAACASGAASPARRRAAVHGRRFRERAATRIHRADGRSSGTWPRSVGCSTGSLIGHVIHVTPAHAVRGPKYVVQKGKTSVLTAGGSRAARTVFRQ